MRVLVTGAGGFTGGHLARALAARGHETRGLVRNPAHADALRAAGVVPLVGDITDRGPLRQALEGTDVVYHIAALFRQAGVPDAEYRRVNVDASRTLVEEARAAGVGRVVHCSTVGVHGDVEGRASEDAPFRPGDVYQRTKLEGELLAVETAARVGLPLTVVRPGPIYGPGDRRLLKLFKGIARRRFPLLGSGRPRFHLTYIDDLVEGFRLAGETPGAVGRTYIIAGKEAPTQQELFAMIADEAGVEPLPIRLPAWPFWLAGAVCEAICIPLRIEPPIYRRRVAFFTKNREFDISRARAELGYEPRIGAREGIRRTMQSYRDLGWM